MTTRQLINLLLNKLPFSIYGLAKKLNIPYTTFNRYLSGANEANFQEVLRWLKELNLSIVNNLIFLNNVTFAPLHELTKEFVSSNYFGIEDSKVWKKEGAKIEKKEGHAIVWLHNKW